MEPATAATLLLLTVWPNGAETKSTREFSTVRECEASAIKLLSVPKRDGKPFTKHAECMPHYKFSN